MAATYILFLAAVLLFSPLCNSADAFDLLDFACAKSGAKLTSGIAIEENQIRIERAPKLEARAIFVLMMRLNNDQFTMTFVVKPSCTAPFKNSTNCRLTEENVLRSEHLSNECPTSGPCKAFKLHCNFKIQKFYNVPPGARVFKIEMSLFTKLAGKECKGGFAYIDDALALIAQSDANGEQCPTDPTTVFELCMETWLGFHSLAICAMPFIIVWSYFKYPSLFDSRAIVQKTSCDRMAQKICGVFFLFPFFALLINAQYYSPPMMTGSGCVATGNKLYSHGNFIRELSAKELTEMEKYKRVLVEWKQKVDEAYASLEQAVQQNATTLPTIPARPQLPTFCTSNQTTLYILAGCTVQNHKVYISGKFARELAEKEKAQLDEFARQMLAQQNQQLQQSQTTNGTATAPPAAAAAAAAASTTTVSPMNDIGRQIALDFCMEF
uniref:Pepsin inhibitor-3-like repeated domain-containing protein n=1 Tax=Globodera rostochiensis TaxID=31243 RepID=A0A914H3S0_GLORO